MKDRFGISVTDSKQAQMTIDCVKIGHYFVFAEDPKALKANKSDQARLKRLLIETSNDQGRVLPLVDKPVELKGVTITPKARELEPICSVVTDRDLYRSEQDNVHLFIASPNPPKDMRLIIECNGEPFTVRNVELADGVGIETLSMLLPGSYSAQLATGDRRIGEKATFTVAEYTLAPLSGRLLRHELKRDTGELSFELEVESYQVPFDGTLVVALMERERELEQVVVDPLSPGRYTGMVKLSGEGPFRLRLTTAADAERVAEVVLPGSRAVERQVSVVSELGTEVLFSMMPEAEALPMRGGYLSKGDYLATPLVVEEVITDTRLIQVKADVESLVLVNLDMVAGSFHVQEVGDLAGGSQVEVEAHGPMTMVFVGCFVNGQPFEGYTSFVRPSRLRLSVEAPDTVRPRQDLPVRLTCEGARGTTPVLLCVRDQRLTATDTPEVSLGAAAKRCIALATEGMEDSAFTTLDDHSDVIGVIRLSVKFGVPITDPATMDLHPKVVNIFSEITARKYKAIPISLDEETLTIAMADPSDNVIIESINKTLVRKKLRVTVASESSIQEAIDKFFDTPILGELSEVVDGELDNLVFGELSLDETSPDDDYGMAMEAMFKKEASVGELDIGMAELAEDEPEAPAAKKDTTIEPTRSEFPEVLFYGILPVPVDGRTEVEIPLGDSLTTYTVEAFALAEGDWTQSRRNVVVDQPVRVDLELPPAVHPGDEVLGKLRAVTSSGKARITLRCDDKKVPLNDGSGEDLFDTPVELSFAVSPGTYLAKVEDTATEGTDSVEAVVSIPGKIRSYAKELALLQKDESINLNESAALSLRLLPAVDEPFEMLITATADYGHLCCEQTAAKILAATFMYLAAVSEGQRSKAEQIILAGIARERKMLRPGQGFSMYPDSDHINGHYSMLAVRYLWTLHQLDEVTDISRNLREAVREGLSLANQAAEAHRLERVPKRIGCIEDAYAAAANGGDRDQIRGCLEHLIVFGKEARLRESNHSVADRATLAYAAACLVAMGDLGRGVLVANEVTRQFNDQGALYSTVDSVAAIALMIQLRVAGVFASEGRVRVNGKEVTTAEAAELGGQVESVEVLDGVAAVEVTTVREENWAEFVNAFPVRIGFRDSEGNKVRQFKQGDRTELFVGLPEGYQPGDIVHVSLPACLSWIKGGGKVKRFTLDFEGKDELQVPLVVTSPIKGKQRFAVCVRNMFREERATIPGLLAVSAAQ